ILLSSCVCTTISRDYPSADFAYCRLCISLFFFFSLIRPPPSPTLFPYTTLFRSGSRAGLDQEVAEAVGRAALPGVDERGRPLVRSEEHTSELQSRRDLVCRLLLEKKKEDQIISWSMEKQMQTIHPMKRLAKIRMA